jgi:hypothetical protein
VAWAKLHTDILGDDKLLAAHDEGARHLLLLPWLIAFAKRADDEGRITTGGAPAKPSIVARLIPGATDRTVKSALDELASISVLVRDPDGAFRFRNWEKRSGQKGSDTPASIHERVTRYRNKKKREGNALHVTEGNAREVEKEEEKEADTDTDAFARAWSRYPKRNGTNSRIDAERAWSARIREGASPASLLEGTERYRAYCDARGQTGTEFVMQASRFYGASKHYLEEWQAPNAMPPMYEADGVTYTAAFMAWQERTKVAG